MFIESDETSVANSVKWPHVLRNYKHSAPTELAYLVRGYSL